PSTHHGSPADTLFASFSREVSGGLRHRRGLRHDATQLSTLEKAEDDRSPEPDPGAESAGISDCGDFLVLAQDSRCSVRGRLAQPGIYRARVASRPVAPGGAAGPVVRAT